MIPSHARHTQLLGLWQREIEPTPVAGKAVEVVEGATIAQAGIATIRIVLEGVARIGNPVIRMLLPDEAGPRALKRIRGIAGLCNGN